MEIPTRTSFHPHSHTSSMLNECTTAITNRMSAKRRGLMKNVGQKLHTDSEMDYRGRRELNKCCFGIHKTVFYIYFNEFFGMIFSAFAFCQCSIFVYRRCPFYMQPLLFALHSYILSTPLKPLPLDFTCFTLTTPTTATVTASLRLASLG